MSESNGESSTVRPRSPGPSRAERAGIGIGGLLPPLHRDLCQPVASPAPGAPAPAARRGTRRGRPRSPRRAHRPPRRPAAPRTPRRSSPAPAAPREWHARPGRRRGRSRAARGRRARRCRAATRRRSWSRTSPTTGRPSWPHRARWPSADPRRAGGPAPPGTVLSRSSSTCHRLPLATACPALEPVGGPVLEREDAGGVGPVLERRALRPPVGLLHPRPADGPSRA